MEQREASKDLQELRALLAKDNIGPEHTLEFWLDAQHVETLKAKIRDETQGNCYFFRRPEGDRVHLIALLHVEGATELFEKIKGEQSNVSVNQALRAEGPADADIEF